MDSREDTRSRLLRLFVNPRPSLIGSRLSRCSFLLLLAAWGVYLSVMPFLRNPAHIALALLIFLLFALQFIIIELLEW